MEEKQLEKLLKFALRIEFPSRFDTSQKFERFLDNIKKEPAHELIDYCIKRIPTAGFKDHHILRIAEKVYFSLEKRGLNGVDYNSVFLKLKSDMPSTWGWYNQGI